jgi:hypothetical protein
MLMLRQTAALLLLFCFGQGIDGAQGDEWIKVAPVGGGFSVMMPAKPEEEVRPGEDLTAHLFTATTDNALYTIAYGDYAPSVRFNIDDELAANRDNFLKGVDASLKTTKSLTMDGRKGLEFTGENSQASFKSRVFIFGTRFYQIAVAVLRGKDDAEDSNRFFASFEFTRAEVRPKP